MALTNDDRLFMTQLLDTKLEPIRQDVDKLKEDVGSLQYRVGSLESSMSLLRDDVSYLKFQNENEILPRLQNIEACYVSTYERYVDKTEQTDKIRQDVDVLKTVVAEHSQILKNIS